LRRRTEDDEKTYKKETREFMFDGGGNIDPVLGTMKKETRQRGNSTELRSVAYKERRATKIEP